MTLPLTLLSLSLSVLQAHALPANQLHARETPGIQWGKECLVESPLAPLECGTLTVPLDYTNTSDTRTIELEILKIAANLGPSRGSILTHWGGPGPNGRGDFVEFAPRLQNITGGVFDWILPVQRGSENQTNAFECYANLPGFPAQPEFRSSKSADTRSAENWANAEIFANDCFTAMNLTGEFIGSAFDARDWMSVVDALGEDGLLRYYGVSAGTTLGNHLVSMFPDRIDKVILDGIVNPLEYVRNKEVEIFTDVDKLFTAFCEACVATPENCTLGMNKTAAELEGTIKAAVDGLLEDPIVIQLPGVSGGFLLDYTTVKGAVYSTLYFPWQWTGLAAQFQAILDRDIETLAAAFGGPQATVFVPSSRNEAMYGIKCADSDKYAELADWEVIQDARHEQSYWGDASDIVVSCARWRFDAKERYTGNFTVQTRNPVMLIGNTADPVTPIASARNASAGYEGSVVLQHDSYGHCSHLTQPSLCTGRAIREYFLNGVLPEPGTVCPVDIPLFLSAEEWTLGWLAVGLELGPA